MFKKKFVALLIFHFGFLVSHPDKNPDPDSRKLFVKIANAYEVMS